MPHPILMPPLPQQAGTARLTKWLKRAGENFRAGDVLAEIATATSTMEIEAEADGVLTEICEGAGPQQIAVGAIIARFDAVEFAGEMLAVSPVAEAEIASVPELASAWPEGTKVLRMSVRDALRDAMAEEMRRDPNVFVIGEEVADYEGAHKVTQGLAQEFGEARVIDTPITEHAFAGLGVGAAYAGMRPVVEFMTFNFALQAIDHIVNSAAKIRYISAGQLTCPIVFRGPNGFAPRVGAQHAQDFSAMFANIPGLKVVAPYSAADAKGLLKSAIRDPDPVVFLENEILYGMTFDVPQVEDYLVEIGKARVVRAGADVTLVSFSLGMMHALKAAEALAAEGLEAEVIDLRSIRPLDIACIIASVTKTGRCVTVEEGWPQSGIGAEIAAQIMEHAFSALKAPVVRVTGKDVPMPYAARLEALALPNAGDVVAAVRRTMGR